MHVVTEQGIAYLYQAETREERTKLMACIAQNTPLGEMGSESEILEFRRAGKVAIPEDLDIDPAMATKDLLAAKSLEEIREISQGLYEIPDKFKH